MPRINYTIKQNRLEKSYMEGFDLENETLYFSEDTGIHRIYIEAIDAGEDDALWGRFSFAANIPENMALYVYAQAFNYNTWYDDEGNNIHLMDMLRDESLPDEEKKRLFSAENGKRYVGKNDILLYGLSGRYLFLAIEVLGTGDGAVYRMRVDKKGDNFMDAFPGVYRERDSFFHRFLSVFSSVYNDIGREIDNLPELLDIDKCPAECLPVYAKWLGIDLSGDFLPEERMREFVRQAYHLNRIKGTKACLLKVLKIALDEDVIILENNTIKSYIENEDLAESEYMTGGIYDVNILIRTPLTDTDRHQLLYLLDQFKPIRCRLHLITLKDTADIDGEVYLDMNAVISGENVGYMDDDMVIDGDVILE